MAFAKATASLVRRRRCNPHDLPLSICHSLLCPTHSLANNESGARGVATSGDKVGRGRDASRTRRVRHTRRANSFCCRFASPFVRDHHHHAPRQDKDAAIVRTSGEHASSNKVWIQRHLKQGSSAAVFNEKLDRSSSKCPGHLDRLCPTWIFGTGRRPRK